jgi:hypothetical protein
MSLAASSSFAGVRVSAKPAQRNARHAAVTRASDDKPVATGAPRSKESLYLGGIGASEQSLTYLTGSLPGDYGCAAQVI